MANKVIKKSASAGTFTISSDDKALKVSGQVDGGVFNIDGFAADFKVTVKGNTVTLTESDKDTALTSVTFTLKALKSATLKFVDGALTVTQTAEGVKVGTTLVGKGLLLSAATLDEANAYDPDGGSTSTGTPFTLTTDIETANGTSGNDTFSGDLLVNDTGSANTGDIVKGGLGSDTLNLLGNGVSTALLQTESVETVSVRAVAATTAVQTLMADLATLNSEASNAALTVTGADLATTYGLNNTVKGQAAGLTVTYADATGTTDTAKLSINNAGN